MTTKKNTTPKAGYACCFFNGHSTSSSTVRKRAIKFFPDATVSIVSTSKGFYLGINTTEHLLSTKLRDFASDYVYSGTTVLFHSLSTKHNVKRLFDGARLSKSAIREEVQNG